MPMHLLFINSLTDKWLSLLIDQPIISQLFSNWITILIITILICFIVGELTRNFSQVDKIWSIMPIVYSGVTLYAYPYSPRVLIMTLLVTFWGLRLSYNFYRKGGYSIIPWKGEEDYRWAVLRQNPRLKGFRTTIFNLLFISFYQQVLIMLFSTPLLLAAQHADKTLTGLDCLAAGFMFLFIMIETIADNQLYNFHLQKQNKISRTDKFANSLNNGFMIDGMWKYVRHPNFAAEQSVWVSFYFFGVAASGQWLNWTLSGPVLLILLFIGSSDFTESISKQKYPQYQNYQKIIPKFIPVNLKNKR